MKVVRAVITGALPAVVALLTAAAAFGCAAPAGAATLVGGHEQTAINRAFFARPAHRGQAVVSIRGSSIERSWAIVRSVRPVRAGGTGTAQAHVKLSSAYYRSHKGRWQAAAPPAAVRDDLARPFSVAVTYTGSGAETIAYNQSYSSVCRGSGGFTDTQQATISPMSWTVRYVVDLDALNAAVRTQSGVVLVPQVGFLRSRSTVKARQALTRTAIDQGCNGKPTTYTCTSTYGPASPTQGLLSFPATGGLEIGVPLSAHGTGDCDPSDYTLGPSLWDSGATTAEVPILGLVGGKLPANPYAPVKVRWPASATDDGFTQSPCAGDSPSCRDSFSWSGTVTLGPAS